MASIIEKYALCNVFECGCCSPSIDTAGKTSECSPERSSKVRARGRCRRPARSHLLCSALQAVQSTKCQAVAYHNVAAHRSCPRRGPLKTPSRDAKTDFCSSGKQLERYRAHIDPLRWHCPVMLPHLALEIVRLSKRCPLPPQRPKLEARQMGRIKWQGPIGPLSPAPSAAESRKLR